MATWRVGADRDLPVREGDWDGDAAGDSIFTWAGWPDDPDGGKAQRGFLLYDADAPELKGSYKLPFAQVTAGELKAVTGGLRAAASRLPQTDAPQEVLERARAVLDGYFERMERAMTDQAQREQVFAHPARVAQLTFADAQRLTELVREHHAFDPAVLAERSPFFWPAEISSNRLDSYFTRMDTSSLRNYAAEAAAGVAFQNSHNQWQLGFGRSLTGKFEEAGELARVQAEFYTFPGLRLHDVSTDDFILGVRTGLIKDVSIGFYGGSFRCSICGLDMLSWECPHIPGIHYHPTERSQAVADELAFAWVDDAHLAEVSAVYDGATPGAAILKAQQEADGGRLRPEVARVLEARYRIRLPGATRQWAGATVERSVQEEEAMPSNVDDGATEATKVPTLPQVEEVTPLPEPVTELPEEIEELRALADSQTARVRAAAEALGVPEGGDLSAAIRSLRAEIARLQPWEAQALQAEERANGYEQRIAELAPLAEDGRLYRADLLAEALAEGVRAYGERFNAEMYTALLQAAPLAAVKRMRDDWRLVGDQLFAGGRLTVDRPEQPAPPRQGKGTPDAAFGG